jgi:hypothetical protein
MSKQRELLIAVANFAICDLIYFIAPLVSPSYSNIGGAILGYLILAAIWAIIGLIVLFFGGTIALALVITLTGSIFLSIALVGIGGHHCGNSRDCKRILDLDQIKNSLQLYANKCGTYPGGVPGPNSDPRCTGVNRPSQLTGPLTGITAIPFDPTNAGEFIYSYCYMENGASYALQAQLEDPSRPELAHSLIASPSGCQNTVGTVTCDKAKGEYCVGP